MSSRFPLRPLSVLLVASAALAPLNPVLAQEEAQSLSELVSKGKAAVDFRYRFEHVDQANFDKNAAASTLRSRITLTSAQYRGFTFLGEADNVSYIGDDKFNSTTNGKTEYPVVADPKGTEFNQAWVRYDWSQVYGKYGRQRINHANQRFVGGVAWRQNEQTYDGLRAEWNSPSGFNLDYAYVYRVHRIFGPDDGAQPARWNGDNHFVRAAFAFNDKHSLAGFAYSLDIRENEAYPPGRTVDNSSDTYGLEYKGQFGPLAARAAYATQSDGGDSNLDYDADYYVLEGIIGFSGLKATLGYEVLGGDNGVGFKTPLATLHKFQGWADKFLVTPGDGIEDIYVGLTGKAGPVKLGAFYHDFSAEDSSDDFGQEIDLVATWPINKQFSLQLKYANFKTDNSARFDDTEKAWLTAQLKL